jgi:outer membrane lipoprotein SlyB
MDTRQHLLYPLLIVAALAVTVFSMVGIATMTGRLSVAHSEVADAAPRSQSTEAAAARESNSAAPRQKLAASCAGCGVVESIRIVEHKGAGSGLGAVAGGLTGAVVGNQVGRGNGRTAMTLLGGLGGAFAGNEIEKNVKRSSSYQVRLRMDDGSTRLLNQREQPSVAVGDKVRVENGSIVRRT